jgi:nicotinamidase-related amidase
MMSADRKPWTLEKDRTALLIIDMQNAFTEPGGSLEVPMAREVIPNIKRLAERCRMFGMPVIYTVSAHYVDDVLVSPLELAYQPHLDGRLIRPGSHGDEICSELSPEASDFVVRKYRFDAFYGTNLETLLRTLRYPAAIDTLIITGTVTNICCESTARSAFMRDFKVAFLADATGGLDDQSQQATLNILGRCFARIMTVDEVLTELES